MPSPFSPTTATIGAFVWSTNYAHEFDGLIDDVMVFTRPLSAEEITALYANQTSKYAEHNFTDLAEGNYIFTAYTQDAGGNVNKSERTVSVDVTIPSIAFENPTPPDNNITDNNYIYVNVSASDANNISTFIDFNNSLISWWRMDDVNSTGDPIDYMNLNNGTAINQSTQTDAGYLGKGFEFDGDGDYILTEQGYGGENEITVSAWVYAKDDGNLSYIGASGRPGPDRGMKDWILGMSNLDPQQVRFQVSDGVATQIEATTTTGINLNEWTFYVGTYDGQTARIYKNGTEEDNDAFGSARSIGDAGYDLSMGSARNQAGSWGGFWNGTLDDVIILNRSLTDDEILALYANTSSRYLEQNFTNLTDGNYTFKAHTQDRAGNMNETEERTVTITTLDTTPPSITFENPTPPDNDITDNNYIYVNVSASDANNISTFIDFNNSLISWWRMDDINATNDPTDYMNRNNGTAINQSTQTDDGYLGKGFDFDGDWDYINVGNDNSLKPSLPVSISAWIKLSELGEYQHIVSIDDQAPTYYGIWLMVLTTDDISINFGNGAGGASQSFRESKTSSSALTTDTWYHIVAVVRGADDMDIYINGTDDGGSYSGNGNTFVYGTGDVRIGSRNDGYEFNGTIDDVMIFNRSLSAEEVAGLYANKSSEYLEVNYTSLVYGNHTFKAYSQDIAGNMNETEERTVNITTLDTTPPNITFENPTPDDGNETNNSYIYVNVSASDANNISTFIDFNNSLISWWRMDDINATNDPTDYMNRNNGTAINQS
ncbi:MAG: hypothetical protein JSW41_02000, partial [Candidatus Aenigmatarchaeota archaeon]